MVGKTHLDSMLDESGFGAATKMVVFVLYKVLEVSLVTEPFWTSIFTSSISIRADAKQSVSNNFVPSDSLNTNPKTPLMLLLQFL